MRFCTALFVLWVAMLAGGIAWLQQSPDILWYRFTTSAKALHSILTMPPEHVEGFVNSFVLFDQEAVTTNEADAQHIVNYYQVINHLCALGQVEKMYIPPIMDLKLGIFQNQMVWEEKGMADKLDIGPGKKVLDVGCGRGRVAHHVAKYTGANVVGLNLDKTQLALAREHAEKDGMLNKSLEFVHGNYNNPLPFEDQTFDALYHVQALTYAVDLVGLLKEMNRVLKPGAKISFLDWFVVGKYDASDAHHRKLLRETKAVIGAVKTPDAAEYARALKEAGFVQLFSGEASIDGGHQWPLIEQAKWYFVGFESVIDVLVKVGIVPQHIKTLMTRLNFGGESFIEADKLGLFSTSWQVIAQKPLK